ncbi:hypothetical protein LEP1GSC170_0042 [Leptospira interrogans serovar Bataviae str. HAI135]|nr:hypothetical protein LEP1GSC170_0042 [Leptospira interrogans serovar Bataviae str. HAI135]
MKRKELSKTLSKDRVLGREPVHYEIANDSPQFSYVELTLY